MAELVLASEACSSFFTELTAVDIESLDGIETNLYAFVV